MLNEVEVDPNYFCLVEALFLCSDLANAQVPATATCDQSVLGLCLVATEGAKGGIFGFAEFVQAFALLVVIYSFTHARYQFRIDTAPVPLWRMFFAGSVFIGLATLLSDVVFAKALPLPVFLADQTYWQLCLGLMFLSLIFVWLWYAYISPPLFGRRNALAYTRSVYRYVLQGDQNDLPTIAAEIQRSARSIIEHASRLPSMEDGNDEMDGEPTSAHYARDLLLILGNRRFCRAVVVGAPNTAIALFEAMSDLKEYSLPAGQLASHLSTEALLNKDSLLYHEEAGYVSGYLGYVKPFTKALYGDFRLVEGLASANQSPLDIGFDTRLKLDSEQISAYSRAVLATFESAAATNDLFRVHSYALFRAMKTLEGACADLYKLNDTLPAIESDDITRRVIAVTHFIDDAINVLHKAGVRKTKLRWRVESWKQHHDCYDYFAALMFEIIGMASYVTTKESVGWSVQYGLVWNRFFGFDQTETRKIILFKLRRLLYEEITSGWNYRSAKYLGFCLNVMGLDPVPRYRGLEQPLRRAIIAWARKNYLSFVENYPDVAAAVLVGTISFDATNKRLVKTYAKGLERVAPTVTLELDEQAAKSASTTEGLAV